jgi:hypothetical protein
MSPTVVIVAIAAMTASLPFRLIRCAHASRRPRAGDTRLSQIRECHKEPRFLDSPPALP